MINLFYMYLQLKIDVKSAIMLTSNITPIYDQNICNDTPCPILDRNAVTENSLPVGAFVKIVYFSFQSLYKL